MKVLFVSAEVSPFFKAGGLGDVAGSLPQALQSDGTDIRVIMPLYSTIALQYRDEMELVCTFQVPLAWRSQYCGVLKLTHRGVIHYFIDNEYYFKRQYPYGQYDDAERFAFFAKAVMEAMPKIGFMPDVLHVNDWHAAMVPVYLRYEYCKKEGYGNMRSVLTIHNLQYQGIYPEWLLGDVLGLGDEAREMMEFDGNLNFMKGAIETAHAVTTVSPNYAQEIQTPWYGHELDGVLRRNAQKLSGIINGIDLEGFDPMSDPSLFAHFSKDDRAGKAECKRRLQQLLGLTEAKDVPVIGMVSRLVDHKGFDLVAAAAEKLAWENMQLVVLGTGEALYEQRLRELAQRYPGKVSVSITFSDDLARKIYSGADFFLMPSQSEPCGLAQLIAMRYGTLPIVRQTGGLKDTVEGFNAETGSGNGITFYDYYPEEMLRAVHRALELYANVEDREKAIDNAMNADFGWGQSAKAYEAIYQSLADNKY